MFEEPTLDDFRATLDDQNRKVSETLVALTGEVVSRQILAGRLRSGSTVTAILGATRQAFEVGSDAMIGDLKHYAQRSKLDPRQLREVAEAHLIKLLHALTEGAQSQISPLNVGEAAQMAIDRHTSALGSALTYKLREFDIGMSQGGSGLSQSNTINAHTIIGGVQQGSHGSSQHINQSVMLEGLAEAASALEAALTECPRSSVVDDLRVDVATVQSQLAKTEPSQGILSEAGKSIRSIAEGVTAGALTSPAVAAAITLASMLGAA